jgi:hypothetical protein
MRLLQNAVSSVHCLGFHQCIPALTYLSLWCLPASTLPFSAGAVPLTKSNQVKAALAAKVSVARLPLYLATANQRRNQRSWVDTKLSQSGADPKFQSSPTEQDSVGSATKKGAQLSLLKSQKLVNLHRPPGLKQQTPHRYSGDIYRWRLRVFPSTVRQPPKATSKYRRIEDSRSQHFHVTPDPNRKEIEHSAGNSGQASTNSQVLGTPDTQFSPPGVILARPARGACQVKHKPSFRTTQDGGTIFRTAF